MHYLPVAPQDFQLISLLLIDQTIISFINGLGFIDEAGPILALFHDKNKRNEKDDWLFYIEKET